MPNFNSTQHASFVADPRVAIRTQDLGGRIRVLRADFTAVDAAQNDTLTLGRLPKGAMVVGIGFRCGGASTGVTMDLGHSANVDEYIDGLDISTAAVDTWINSVNYTRLPAEDDIIATLLGADPASETYEFTLLYVID